MEQFLFAIALSSTTSSSAGDLSIRPEFHISATQCYISVVPNFDPFLLPEERKTRIRALMVNGDISAILPRDFSDYSPLMHP